MPSGASSTASLTQTQPTSIGPFTADGRCCMSPPDPFPPDSPPPDPLQSASAQPGLSRRRARSTAARPAPKRSRSHRRRELPEYASCEQCKEYHRVTLRLCAGGRVLCANCADTTHPRRRCPICWRVAAFEAHHVASERQHRTLTLRICLNCHSRLSAQQRTWPPAWRTGPHPIRCIVQGVHDVLVLWCEKHSRTFRQSRELFAMLGHAALCLLACLQPFALRDLQALTGWSA